MKHLNTRGFQMLMAAFIVVTLACRAGLTSRDSRSSEVVQNGSERTVNVSAREFSFSLDATEVEAGTVTFVVQNEGTMHHDFAIRSNGVEEKTPMIEPGESAYLTVDLAAGTYTYLCTIPGHEQAGMSGTFTVISN